MPDTLTELFEKVLLPVALQCHISYFEFWEYTVGEIVLFIKNFKENEKNRKMEMYDSAQLIATCVLSGLNGKPFPTLQEFYPTLFANPQPQEDKSWMLYKEQMIDFANAFNKKRQAKEGEKIIET